MLWGLAHIMPLLRSGPPSSDVRFTAIAVARASLQRADCVIPPYQSMRLWAVVKLGLPTDICEAMLRHCAESLLSEVAATSNVEEMQWCPQSFANVAWSAAKLSECGSLKGYATAAVVCAAVAKQAQLCLESFKPHELSMMAWACATMHGRKKSGNNARPDGAAALTWAAEEFNVKKPAKKVESEDEEFLGWERSVLLDLPPLAAIVLAPGEVKSIQQPPDGAVP